MAKQTIAGIGVSGGFASLAVIESDNEILELKHLEEIQARPAPFWYLDLLNSVDRKVASRMRKIAFSFNADPVYVHAFPVDADLNAAERDDHSRWELSQILPGYTEEIFPSRIMPMPPKPDEPTADVVAVAMDSGILGQLTDALREWKFHLGPVTAEMSAVGRALYRSHPEERDRRPAYVHIGADGYDLVRYLEGEITGFQMERSAGVDELFTALQTSLAPAPPDMLYVYGTGVNPQWTRMLRTAYGKQFMTLNPFRRLRIATTVHNFGRFIGKEHRFPAAIGAALSS